MNDTISQFKAAIHNSGLEPPDVIEAGKLHRFPTNGKRGDDAGWCKLFPDMRGGVFGDHRSGLSEHWQAKTDRVMTASEREAFQRMVAESKHQAELEERKRHEAAALKAAAILDAATGAPATHPYAVKKRVPLGSLVKRGPWLQRGWDDALLVPIYGADERVWSIEAINADGEKDSLKHGKKRGGFYPIGEICGAARMYIAEGIANAAVGAEVDQSPAVAALCAGNLKAVALAVRELAAPGADIIILADNDVKPDGSNPGLKAANEAAAAVGGRVVVPELGDLWDLWNEHGIEAVRAVMANTSEPTGGEPPSNQENAAAGETNEQAVARLASMKPMDYDRVREAEAKQLGVRVTTLDAEVAKAREERNPPSDGAAAKLLGLDARRARMPAADTLSAPSDCFVLPGNGVTISGCAADIFGDLAHKKTTFVRSGVVSELTATKHCHALCAVSPAGFRSRIERYKPTYAWVKTRHGKLALCPKPCPEDIAKALLASLDARELLPPVDLVLATPILVEREGRLEPLGRGYHEHERLLITKGELPLPVELGAAVRSLQELLSDFLFPTPGDRSRALASLITPALTMGGLLGGYAPLDIAEATAPQSGKGYRQKLTHAVYGESAYTVARREGGVGSIDESLGMALFSGKPFILIDNIRGLLASQYLESVITFPEQVAVRIPRREEIQVDASRVTFQLTSNGAESTPDLAARSCITRIRKQPPGYKFRVYPEGYLLDHVRKNQPHYLGCVFAVVTEWYAKDKPTIRGSSHDFRDWAEALDWIVQRLFKAAPLLEGHDCAQERASDPALTWLRHVCIAAAKTNQLGVELSASALLELCEDEDITLPRRIGTNPGDGAKGVGQVLAKLYREAEGDTLAVDEYEMRRIETDEYHSVQRKHRKVKRYVIQWSAPVANAPCTPCAPCGYLSQEKSDIFLY